MRTFKVNGKEYKAKPIEFGTVCNFEEMGVSITDAKEKSFSFLRTYFALCANETNEFATKEIQSHVVAGGDLKDISDALNDEMEKSAFFRALRKSEEEDITEGAETETAETTDASETGEAE